MSDAGDREPESDHPPESASDVSGEGPAAVKEWQPPGECELIADLHQLDKRTTESPTLIQLHRRGRFRPLHYVDVFGSWSNGLDAANISQPDAGPGGAIPRCDILLDLQRLVTELDRPPVVDDLREHGRYNLSPYQRHFGTWTDALEVAPLDPGPLTAVPKAALICEYLRVGVETGQLPTADHIEWYSRYPLSLFQSRFGAVHHIRDLVTVDISTLSMDTARKQRYLTELQRLCVILDEPPSVEAIRGYSTYRVGAYRFEFGSLVEALAAAQVNGEFGFDIPTTDATADIINSPGRDELADAIASVTVELAAEADATPDNSLVTSTSTSTSTEGIVENAGVVPDIETVVAKTEYTRSQYEWEFDSWSNALRAAGIRSIQGASRRELIGALQALHEELGHIPSPREMDTDGEFSITPYYRIFGSWGGALTAADIT